MHEKFSKEKAGENIKNLEDQILKVENVINNPEELEKFGEEKIQNLNKKLIDWKEKVENLKKKLDLIPENIENEDLEKVMAFKASFEKGVIDIKQELIYAKYSGGGEENQNKRTFELALTEIEKNLIDMENGKEKSQSQKSEDRIKRLESLTLSEQNERSQQKKESDPNYDLARDIASEKRRLADLNEKIMKSVRDPNSNFRFALADLATTWSRLNFLNENFPGKEDFMRKLKNSYELIEKEAPGAINNEDREGLQKIMKGYSKEVYISRNF